MLFVFLGLLTLASFVICLQFLHFMAALIILYFPCFLPGVCNGADVMNGPERANASRDEPEVESVSRSLAWEAHGWRFVASERVRTCSTGLEWFTVTSMKMNELDLLSDCYYRTQGVFFSYNTFLYY